MRFLRKPVFTLLELLIVLFILSLGAIITGVKVKEAYEEQLFLSETEQILNHLQMAQDLMLIMDTDVYFHLIKNRDGTLMCYLDVEKPLTVKKASQESPDGQYVLIELDRDLSIQWTHLIERKVSLKAIKSFHFITHEYETRNSLQLLEAEHYPDIIQAMHLSFSLGKMSMGELLLSTASDIQHPEKKANKTYSIVLRGYPCPIRKHGKLIDGADKIQGRLMTEEEKIQENKRLYPKLT